MLLLVLCRSCGKIGAMTESWLHVADVLAQSTPTPSPTTSAELHRVLAQGRADDQIDFVLIYVCIAGGLAFLWYFFRGWSARGNSFARRWVLKLAPYVAAGAAWVRSAPATFVYMACWTATTILIQGTPQDLVEILTRFNSTNIFGILVDPVRVLVSSALLVADSGAGFLGYVLVYVLIVARLEHRLGSARVIMVWIASHVLGSLATVLTEVILIKMHYAEHRLAVTADVGVSYVMVGSMGAYLFLVSKPWRWWYYAAVFAGVGLPVIFVGDLWSFGHLNATLLGIVAFLVVRRFAPLRERLDFSDYVADARENPSFVVTRLQ